MVKMFQLSASSRALICTTCRSKTVIWQCRVLGMVQRIVRERLGKNSHQAKSRLCVFAYSHQLLRQSHSWLLVLSIPPLTSGDPDTSCVISTDEGVRFVAPHYTLSICFITLVSCACASGVDSRLFVLSAN